MKASKVLSLIVGLLALNCIAGPSQTSMEPAFAWTNRPELSLEQQRLLRLNLWLEDPELAAEKRQRFEAEAKQISEKLGSAKVRAAKPLELLMTMEKG